MSEKRLISSSVLFAAIEEELQNRHQASFTITGMSMWPFLCHERDKVIITSCAAADLKKGDIVLLQTPLGNYLLHRVTGRKTGMFETTGDGNCFQDGWFPDACLQARVVSLIRKDKTIDCLAWQWKLIFRLWMCLFPMRKPLLILLKKIGKHRKHKRY